MSTALPTHRFAQRIVRLVVLALVATMLSLGIGATSTATAAPAKPTTPRPDSRIQGIDPDAPVDSEIKGLVYDQEGRPLDNIQVEAFSSADPGADPVASDLTYEYEDSASHGAYELHVPAGDYLVRFSSPDDARKVYETVFHGGGAGTAVAVGATDTVTLPDAVLSRETGAPVTGIVRGTDGQPLAGAEVSLIRTYADGDYSYLDYVLTDAEGRYTFEGVNRGRTHTVAASYYWEDEAGDSWVWLPTQFLGQQPVVALAQTFTVPAGSAGTTIADLSLRAGVPVTGLVTGPTGQPLRYAEVMVYAVGPDGALHYAGWAETESDGTFVRAAVPGATYTVAVYDSEGDETYLGDVTDPSNAETFSLGTTAYDVGTIQVGARGSLVSVTVLDADGDPTDDHSVQIWRKKADDTVVPVGPARSYGDGAYQRRLDWGLDYTFEVVTDDDASHFLGGATTIDGATFVRPTEAVPTLDAGTITVPGATPGKLRGTVEADGAPLADASVRLHGRYVGCDAADEEECWDSLDETVTSASGSYHFRMRPWMSEDYSALTVAASLDELGYNRAFVGGDSFGDATTYAAPEAGAVTVVDTITLAIAPGTVRGTVVPDGVAFDGEAYVNLYCWSPDDGYWDAVDSLWTATGGYALRADRAYDACLVSVTYYDDQTGDTWRGASVAGSWPTEDVTGVDGVFPVAYDGTVTTAPEVTVHKPASITGTISTVDDQPLDGEVNVRLYRWDEADGYWESWQSDWLETDDGLSYSFDEVDAGTYAVRATYDAYFGDNPYVVTWSGGGGQPSGPGAPGTVAIGSDGASATLDVVLAHRGPVTGAVVDEAGDPVAGARVVVRGSWCGGCGSDFLTETTTDASGTYSVSVEGDDYDQITIGATKASSGYAMTYLGGVTDPYDATYLALDEAGVVVDDLVLQLRPNTLVVDLSTEDDEPLGESTTDVYLQRWIADDDYTDGGYFAGAGSYFVDGAGSLVVTDLEPGTYGLVASHRPHAGDQRYVPTWYGGGQPSSAADTDRVFTIVEGTNPTAIGVELQRGVALAGVVSTGTGAAKTPLGQVYINVSGWSDASDQQVYGYTQTDDTGRYLLRVPQGSVIQQVSASRDGLTSVNDYSSDPALITMGGTDRTHDISMDPNWGQVGSTAGARDLGCLAHQGYSPELDGLELYTPGRGQIVRYDSYYETGLSSENRSAGLAPLASDAWSYFGPTWGTTSTGALCIQWGAGSTDSAVYQAILTPTGAGGFDVVYNYDTVPTSSVSTATVAGHADGLRSFGERVVFPDGGTGYADEATTGLVHRSLGSDVEGRYAFHFDGFAPRANAPYGGSPRIQGTRGIGHTLTASVSNWYDSDTEEAIAPEDVTLHYRWRRASTTLGTDPTYVVQASDYGKLVRLDVEAKVDGHAIGYRWSRVRITKGTVAATNAVAPSLSPDAPAIGGTVTLDPGSWTPADGLVAEDLSYAYQWYRGSSRLWDAAGTTYVTTESDAGRRLTVKVLVSASGRGTVSATTAPVTVARPPELPQLAATTAPTLVGAAKVGQTLTVDPGAWDASDVTFSYQWYAGWRLRSADSGTGGTSYTPTAADRGELITVRVTASAADHRDGTASASVGPVVAADVATRTLTFHVVDEDTDHPVAGAYVYACEDVDWTCVPAGTTNGSGVFTATALAGRDYSVSVYPSSPYRSATQTVPGSGPAEVTIALTKPTPKPANVELPTSNGTYDGVPVVYWQEDQALDVTGCATTASPTYTVTFTDGTATRTGVMTRGVVTGTLAVFHATIPAFYPSHGDITIATNVPADCAPGTPTTKVNVYIDPSGIVTDQYGRTIEGATVTLLRSDNAGGPYTQVPDGSDVMSPDNRNNPSLTDDTGFFRWDVEEGWYRVKAAASGCTTTTTDSMQVPPIRVDLLIRLQCDGATAPAATPTISGTPAVGQTLATSPDVWGDPLDEVTVQWLRDNAPIEGATGASYQLQQADSGKAISVKQTARRPTYTQETGHGAPVSFTAVSGTSAAAQVAGDPAPVATVAPAITGTRKVGSTLGSTAPTWSLGGVSNSLEWYANGTPTGVTTNAFPLTAGDVGKVITVKYVGRLAGHIDGAATSAPATVAKGDAASASVKPAISGTPRLGQTLTAAPGTWSASGLAYRYQWKRAGAAIAGATASTYTPTAADVGKAVTVTVLATRVGYQDGTATSAAVTVAKRTSTVTITVPKKAVAGKKATISGVVAVVGVAGPLGTVTLVDGKKTVGTVTLKAASKGKVSFVLKKLKAGTHKLKLTYGGTADTTGTTSTVVKLKVTKPKKKTKGKHRIVLPELGSLF